MNSLSHSLLAFSAGLWAWGSAASAAAPTTPVSFENQIRPLLEKHCYDCHGPAKRKAGLRLSNRRDAFLPSDTGEPVIRPGHGTESLLFQKITATNPDQRMPKDRPALPAEDIALLRQWIDAGAEWPADETPVHWAYLPPQRPALPTVRKSSWVRNEIDAFVLAQLESRGLAPSAEVDRAKLLRRASLDLTGLPPSPEEVDAFVRDSSPNAYERVVDRLLKSPRFGERWARQWLDLARYADSNGFQADQLRDSWAYRDWVINALNADMPFDRFTIEQLAGDLLPDATVDQKIATGFHRTVTCNVEAGVHPEENRVNQVVDRVNTTGMVWLGTTLECCQCHNHKYDPFTMTDYYSVFAYFNNTPVEVRNPSGKGVSFDFYGPKMELPLPANQDREHRRLQAQLKSARAELATAETAAADSLAPWIRDMRQALAETPEWQTLQVADFQSAPAESHKLLEDGSLLLPGEGPDRCVTTVTVTAPPGGITGIRLEALTDPSLPSQGPGRNPLAGKPNFVLQELEVFHRAANGKRIPLKAVNAKADFYQSNFPPSELFDGEKSGKQNGWAINPQFGKPHWVTFELSPKLQPREGDQLEFRFTQNYGGGRTLGRIRLSAVDGIPGQTILPAEIVKLLRQPKHSKKEKQQLADYHSGNAPEVRALKRTVADLDKQLKAIQPDTTLVMVEMEDQRETHIMKRGDYLSPGPAVEAGVPAVLHPQKSGRPANRLGFAQWLVDRDNPLVARVTINRWWTEIMGQGIVDSVEDFGTQSDPPSHPKLLDWLAVDFMDHGWSMKRTLKQIVMSATYRQGSVVTPDLLEQDPLNRFYARGPRFRLPAEMLRDNALAISGMLSTRMGGPPVMPYQPPGLWRQVGRNEPKWVESPAQDYFRRGIYVVYRRAAPYPSFVNFDAPDRSSCVLKRPRTNTPLQALTLLNDPVYVELGLALAGRVLQENPGASDTERIRHALRLCIAREPSDREIQPLLKLLQSERQAFKRTPSAAQALLQEPTRWTPPEGLDPAELAAWFTVANVLLNLDETITKG